MNHRLDQIDASVDEEAVRRLFGKSANRHTVGFQHAVWHAKVVLAHRHRQVRGMLAVVVEHGPEVHSSKYVAIDDQERLIHGSDQTKRSRCTEWLLLSNVGQLNTELPPIAEVLRDLLAPI